MSSANKSLFPKLHPNNLVQLRSALKHPNFKDGIWFHGDGNMYMDEKNSDDRVDFHNPHPGGVNEPAKYRVHLTKTSGIPANLDEMADLLVSSYQTEMIERQQADSVQGDTSTAFGIDEPLVPGPGAKPAVVAPIQALAAQAPAAATPAADGAAGGDGSQAAAQAPAADGGAPLAPAKGNGKNGK